MVIHDGISNKGKDNSGGFMSFFDKIVGYNKSPAKTTTLHTEVSNKDLSQDGRPSSMTLKLSTPTSPQADGPPQLLSDILMNQELFDVFHGKSLILQAEVTVEKPLGGSSKSIIVSGQVPVTLSKGIRNGRPTREIRVRGHLRRKRSNELGVAKPPEILSSSDRLGSNSAINWETEDKYALSERNKHRYGWKSSPKNLALSSVEQAEYQTSSPFRTYSNMGEYGMENRNNIGPWNSGESGYLDQENPTGIANWSPYFDYGSPMSGQTVQGNPRLFQENWDLREKTPTPRFPSPKNQEDHQHFPLKDDKENTVQKSPTCNYRTGDWSPYINIATSSTSNRGITKTEPLQNKNDSGGRRRHGGPCMLSRRHPPVEGEEVETVNAQKGGKVPPSNELNMYDDATQTNGTNGHQVEVPPSKELNLYDDATQTNGHQIEVSQLNDHNLLDDATQTDGRRRIVIRKISHQVGEKFNHLKEMIRPKRNLEESENADGGKPILSKILPKKFSKAKIPLAHDENENNHSNTYGKKQVHDRQHGDEETLGIAERVHDQHVSTEPNPIHLFRREMESKLVQARGSSIDKHSQITGKNGRQVHATLSSPEKLEKCVCGKTNEPTNELNRAHESKLAQAKESVIDKFPRTTKSCNVHAHETLSDTERVDNINGKSYKPICEYIPAKESKLVHARETTDNYCYSTRRNNGHATESLWHPEKVNKSDCPGSDKPMNEFNHAMESKLVEAKESSTDDYLHHGGKTLHFPSTCPYIARRNGDHAPQTLGDLEKYAHIQDKPIEKMNKQMESKSVQTGENSTGKYQHTAWDIGGHAREKLHDLEKKVQELIHNLQDFQGNGQHEPASKLDTYLSQHHSHCHSPFKAENRSTTHDSPDIKDFQENAQHDPASKLDTHLPQSDSHNHSPFKAENRSTTHDSPDTKKVKPIATITISRSRTRFFRYNGLQQCKKAGPQVVTIEAPKGLFYSTQPQ